MTTKYFARVMKRAGIVAAATAIAVVGGTVRLTAAAADVQMCHVEGNGGYHLVTVNSNAEPAHRAHGDAAPGELVPGDNTHEFDAECGQIPHRVESTLACPCWNTYTQSTLFSLLSAVSGTPYCTKTASFVTLSPNQGATRIYAATAGFCVLSVNGAVTVRAVSATQAASCMAEATAIASSISYCPQ